MDILQLINRDFLLIDATWSAERAHALLSRIKPRLVVVRCDISEAKNGYYLFKGNAAELNLDAAAAGSNVFRALAVPSQSPLPVIGLDAIIEDTATPTLVVGPQGVIGLLTSERPTRGTDEDIPEDGVRVKDAQFSAELPDKIVIGTTATLKVILSSALGSNGLSRRLPAQSKTETHVIVTPLNGLSVVGRTEVTLAIPEASSGVWFDFKISAERVGNAKLQIHVLSEGAITPLQLILHTSVILSPDNTSVPRQEPAPIIDFVSTTAPDLSVYIIEVENQLNFYLRSANGRLRMEKFGPVRFDNTPREHFRTFFRDIEGLQLKTPEQRVIAQRKLEAKGANLFDIVFPSDLKLALWDLKEQILTVQITSDEPWIPWEVCRLVRQTPDQIEEGPFFAEAFEITRWLYNVPAAETFNLSNIALVVPGDSGLPQRENEKQYLLSLESRMRKVTPITPSYLGVTQAMSLGEYDSWHFAGHARADQSFDANRSAIELLNRVPLPAEEVAGNTARLLRTRPFVFLNACQTAQAGLSLTGVGGWAQRLLQPGTSNKSASTFIGSYWSVSDDLAFGFARALYADLLSGKTIGQATKRARTIIRGDGDPSWLAYTVYADPNATIRNIRAEV